MLFRFLCYSDSSVLWSKLRIIGQVFSYSMFIMYVVLLMMNELGFLYVLVLKQYSSVCKTVVRTDDITRTYETTGST